MESITNRNQSHFLGFVTEALQSCTEFSIASAFIDSRAIDLIEATLKRNRRLKRGFLLIGVYGGFNTKGDIERLLKLSQQYSKLLIHISVDRKFHWKFCRFYDGKSYSVFIGSANFTAAGLVDNAEIVIKHSFRSGKDKGLLSLQANFEKEWKRSKPVSKFPLGSYKSVPKSAFKFKPSKELSDFFDQTEQEKLPEGHKIFVTFLTGDLSRLTKEAVLAENSYWERKNINYFVCSDHREFQMAKQTRRFVIIYRMSGSRLIYCSANYFDSSVLKTKEGRYFIAYSVQSNDKLLTKRREVFLKETFGVNLRATKRRFGSKVLGSRQADALKNALF